MGHLKLLISLVLVFFIFDAKLIHSKEMTNFVTTWSKAINESKSTPVILKSNNTFIRIGCDKQSFFIHPIDTNTKPCLIPAKGCPRYFQAVALGNGKIIIIDDGNVYRGDNDHIVIVDPRACTNRTVEFDKPGLILDILTYFDKFDIRSEDSYGENRKVYRYDNEGTLYDTIHDPFPFSSHHIKAFFTFKEFNPLGTYFACLRFRRKSNIRAFNATYRETGSFYFDHNIHAFTTEHNRFGMCYLELGYDEHYLHCKILDSSFKSLVNATAIETPKSIDNGDMAIHNTQDGGAILIYSIKRFVGSTHVYYHRIYANGSVSERLFITEANGYPSVHIQEMNAATNEYCVYLAGLAKVDAFCFNA